MAMRSEDMTEKIIGAAIEVHRHLGPGLLESAYRRCMVHELGLKDLRVNAEMAMDLDYKGLVVPSSYRLDLLVEDTVIVEIKAVEKVLPIHEDLRAPSVSSVTPWWTAVRPVDSRPPHPPGSPTCETSCSSLRTRSRPPSRFAPPSPPSRT